MKPDTWVWGTAMGWAHPAGSGHRGNTAPSIRQALGLARPGLCHLFGYKRGKLVISKDLTEELLAFAKIYGCERGYELDPADDVAFRVCQTTTGADKVFEEHMWKAMKQAMKEMEDA